MAGPDDGMGSGGGGGPGPLASAVEAATAAAEGLPEDDDYHYYASFRAFAGRVEALAARAEALLATFGGGGGGGAAALPSWPAGADTDDAAEWLVDVQDGLMERVDAALDEARGQRPSSSSAALPAAAVPTSAHVRRVPFHVATLPRPQARFKDAVDNANAAATNSSRTHPQEDQLRDLRYPSWQLAPAAPQPAPALDDTPFTLVETPEQLAVVVTSLRKCREIAVDLENHHYRSFQGFTCVMQLSTRTEDFVVDVLALRSHIGQALGPIFADPAVLKVLHGADRDVMWLQRDFGIYILNLFDTGQASRVLQRDGHGLASLLSEYCGVQADKRYQLADWRLRPLPADMLKYAREDTHYLLHIYDRLREALLRKDSKLLAKGGGKLAEDGEASPQSLLLEVLNRSKALCCKLYEKELLTETSHLRLYQTQQTELDARQLAVLAGLYRWRDAVARREDESTGYVLPNHVLLRLAEQMPGSVHALLKSVRRFPLVAKNAQAVLEVIVRTREAVHLHVPPPPLLSRRQPDGVSGATKQQPATSEVRAIAHESGSALKNHHAVGDANELRAANTSEAARVASNCGSQSHAGTVVALDQITAGPTAETERSATSFSRRRMAVVVRQASTSSMFAGRPTLRTAEVVQTAVALVSAARVMGVGAGSSCGDNEARAGQGAAPLFEARAATLDVHGSAPAPSHPQGEVGQQPQEPALALEAPGSRVVTVRRRANGLGAMLGGHSASARHSAAASMQEQSAAAASATDRVMEVTRDSDARRARQILSSIKLPFARLPETVDSEVDVTTGRSTDHVDTATRGEELPASLGMDQGAAATDNGNDEVVRWPEAGASEDVLLFGDAAAASGNSLASDLSPMAEIDGEQTLPVGTLQGQGDALPLSLAEAHRQSVKKRRKEAPVARASDDATIQQGDGRPPLLPFDYTEAQKVLRSGRQAAYEPIPVVHERKRGKAARRVAAVATTVQASEGGAFDPMLAFREEAMPDGLKPGKRSQVYPRSGNRSATF
eukprot:SM000065S20192  [mRNA]  locus=s65:263503:269381:- [translate_table: standard]